jgi:DMSO/TMAO reductase YedYZ molybdopterin-dependent catalytic subunit
MGRFPEDTAGITPVEDLFVYHIFGTPPALRKWQARPETYRLELKGLVESPQSFSAEDIRQKFGLVSAVVILQCMTRIHWGRVEVKGARLIDVINSAKPKPGAIKAAIFGGEGFTTDLFLEEIATEPERFLLAYEMNGEALTADHGFPVRVVADGKYAYKWCKWLTAIEIVDYDFKGHYEGVRRWSDKAARGQPVI